VVAISFLPQLYRLVGTEKSSEDPDVALCLYRSDEGEGDEFSVEMPCSREPKFLRSGYVNGTRHIYYRDPATGQKKDLHLPR